MSNSFLTSLKTKDNFTENGMPTHSTSNSYILDLFFRGGAMRSAKETDIVKLFLSAYNEDKLLAIKILFWIRDVRGGAGERRFFKTILNKLIEINESIIINNIELIPEFGRWDDLFELIFQENTSDELKNVIVEYIRYELLKNTNSLLAKWLPRKGKEAAILRNLLSWSPKFYRKTLVGLTNVVETKMCSNKWEDIEYKHVPSLAMTRYRTAFYKHDEDRFGEFNKKVISGEETINTGAIYPYDVIKQYMCKYDINNTEKNSIIAQWNNLTDYLSGSNDFRILPICDVSGSMTFTIGSTNLTALMVCISLGIYISERNVGPFKDHFMTFSEQPKLQYLTGNVIDRINQLQRSEWGMSTNLEATFKEILDKSIANHVPTKDMPTHLLILSDMEFNGCIDGKSDTAMEMIRRMYNNAGYELPNVIFWNLMSRNENVPVKIDTNGVALVSGFSPSIMKSLLNGNLNPMKVMLDTINVERYSKIKV